MNELRQGDPSADLWEPAQLGQRKKNSPLELLSSSETFFSSPHSAIGWSWRAEESAAYPVLALQEKNTRRFYWWNTQKIMPVRSARATFEKELLRLLCKFVSHDFNGKTMGLKGILAEWKERAPDHSQLKSDTELLEESLDHLAAQANLLTWLFQDSSLHQKPLTLATLQNTLAGFTSRFFNPANSFLFTPPEKNHTLLCTPRFAFFWINITALALVATQKPREIIHFSLDVCADQETSILQMKIKCDDFPRLLQQEEVGLSQPQRLCFFRWLTLFCHAGGTFAQTSSTSFPLILELPVRSFPDLPSPHLKIGYAADEIDFGHAVEAESWTEIIPLLANHIFDWESLSLNPDLAEPNRSWWEHVLSSLPELPCSFSPSTAATSP